MRILITGTRIVIELLIELVEMVDLQDVESSSSIKSYGLIVFFRDTDSTKFLLIQKRETYEYMTFMKGKWRTRNDVNLLFSKMTKDERYRIRNYTFDELWNDLWISDKYSFYTSGYNHADRKYREIRNSIPHLLDSTSSDTTHLPWEFPKGKKSTGFETYVECAFREFYEETGIHTKNVELISGCVPVGEIYVGGDNRKYSTLYYIAEAKELIEPKKFSTPKSIRKMTVSSEAIDAKWMTAEELTPLVSRTRRIVIKKILRLISTNKI